MEDVQKNPKIWEKSELVSEEEKRPWTEIQRI